MVASQKWDYGLKSGQGLLFLTVKFFTNYLIFFTTHALW